MEQCQVCKRNFPDHLIQPLITNKDPIEKICPLCALKEVNKRHGLPKNTPFHGDMAQSLWQEAKDYLEETNGK